MIRLILWLFLIIEWSITYLTCLYISNIPESDVTVYVDCIWMALITILIIKKK